MNLPPIVMIPGLLCTEDLYRAQIAALPSGTVYLADTRSADTIPAMAEQLVADAPAHFTLCGLSMGGYVALEVMRLAPERVTSLLLLATSARADTAEQTALRRRLVALAYEKGIAAVAEVLTDRLLGPDGRNDSELCRRIIAMAEAIGIDGFARQQEAIIRRRDQTQLLPRIAVPTTLMAGTADQIIPPACSRNMAAAIPDATFELLEGLGHMLTMEAPKVVSEAVGRLLAPSSLR